MSNENASEEARKGLFDAVKGKAKEVVGAVTGNDSLTTEGQLQSAQARERAEANATELAAQAQSEEAAEDLAAVRNTAEQQRDAASASAESSTESARRVQQAQHVAAEKEKHQTVRDEVADAEVDARAEQIEAVAEGQSDAAAATRDELDAVQKHGEEVAEAEAARAAADRARRNAASLREDINP